MPDVEGKSSKRRYKAKLVWLLRKGLEPDEAIRKARGYAGGKMTPERTIDEIKEGKIGLPYEGPSDLPESVRNVLPPDAQEVWMAVFNQYYEEGVGESESAARAWAAVKEAGYVKDDESGKWVKASEGYALSLDGGATWQFASELSYGQIMDKVMRHLHDVDINKYTNKYVQELYPDYAIIRDYDSDKTFKVPYWVHGSNVELGDMEEVEVIIDYQPVQMAERLHTMNVLEFGDHVPDEIEVMRTGEWQHPEYGNVKITEGDIDNFIKNFYDRVRGVDIAIDQAHRPDDGAAGWFKDLYKRESDKGVELWAKVEWTSLGKELVSDKIYRYISPEFTFHYKDSESGEELGNVLFGAALTNRPFLKHMAPVVMSEVTLETHDTSDILDKPKKKKVKKTKSKSKTVKKMKEPKKKSKKSKQKKVTLNDSSYEGGRQMDLKYLTHVLKLDEEAGAKEVRYAIKDLLDKASKAEDYKKQALELSEQVDKLKSSGEKLADYVGNVEMKLREAEWRELSQKAMNEGRMTKKQAKKLEKRFMKDPDDTKEIIEMMEPVVDFKEKGSSRTLEGSTNMAIFNRKVTEKMSEQKDIDYSQAVRMVADENPSLWDEVDRERRGG